MKYTVFLALIHYVFHLDTHTFPALLEIKKI